MFREKINQYIRTPVGCLYNYSINDTSLSYSLRFEMSMYENIQRKRVFAFLRYTVFIWS